MWREKGFKDVQTGEGFRVLTRGPGDSGKSQCTIEVDHEDFKQMLADPQLGMQLYFQGKLKVTGDPMLATKLQQFFSLTDQD